jgi:hypothetical protein
MNISTYGYSSFFDGALLLDGKTYRIEMTSACHFGRSLVIAVASQLVSITKSIANRNGQTVSRATNRLRPPIRPLGCFVVSSQHNFTEIIWRGDGGTVANFDSIWFSVIPCDTWIGHWCFLGKANEGFLSWILKSRRFLLTLSRNFGWRA